jgi:hypothetical protein
MMMNIVQCPSCDGYGWVDDDDAGAHDCSWCAGIGYVYRDARGVDRKIPLADHDAVAETLERLETERLRQLGYSGAARHPREQAVRKPPQQDDSDDQ